MDTSSDRDTKISQPLTDDLFRSFKLVKSFVPQQTDDRKPVGQSGRVIGLDFDQSGEYCVASTDDEKIVLYDCLRGKEHKVLYSKKYGIHHLKFAHTKDSIIHTSTKEDDVIRYLSLYDNRYLRYFRGHKKRVVDLGLSPVDDTFISASLDDTVRLWDLRSNACQGVTNVQGSCKVAFDPHGLLFALGMNNNSIRFYDIRSYEQGPFGMIPDMDNRSDFKFDQSDSWVNMEFHNNGTDLLVTTVSGRVHVFDTLEYRLKYSISGIDNSTRLSIPASFTADGKYVVSGSDIGHIHVWNAENGKHVVNLEGHKSPVTIARFGA